MTRRFTSPTHPDQRTGDDRMSIFDKGAQTYRSDIELGKKYRDEQTGIEGVATAVYFFQHACERVTLERVVREKIEESTFDAPRLVSLDTGKTARTEKTGGPERSIDARPAGPDHRGSVR